MNYIEIAETNEAGLRTKFHTFKRVLTASHYSGGEVYRERIVVEREDGDGEVISEEILCPETGGIEIIHAEWD